MYIVWKYLFFAMDFYIYIRDTTFEFSLYNKKKVTAKATTSEARLYIRIFVIRCHLEKSLSARKVLLLLLNRELHAVNILLHRSSSSSRETEQKSICALTVLETFPREITHRLTELVQ